jgi:hypothetical protein
MANYEKRVGNFRHSTTIFKSSIGWEYISSRQVEGKTYLRCSIRTCKGTGQLLHESDVLVDKKAHDHPSSAYNQLSDVKNKLKTAAKEDLTNRSLRGIFNEVTREHPDGGQVSFG